MAAVVLVAAVAQVDVLVVLVPALTEKKGLDPEVHVPAPTIMVLKSNPSRALSSFNSNSPDKVVLNEVVVVVVALKVVAVALTRKLSPSCAKR